MRVWLKKEAPKVVQLTHRESDDQTFVRLWNENEDYVVGFEVYVAVDVGGTWTEINDGIAGHVKWDGCVNFDGGVAMVHLCGPEDADELATTIRAIYREAHDMLRADYEKPAEEALRG